MFNNLFKFALSFLFLFSAYSFATEVRCAPELKYYYDKIMQVPEAQTLVQNILKEGSIEIVADKRGIASFGALWDIDNRRIVINKEHGRTEGRIICSIIFELHNAAVSSKYDQLDALAEARKIDKESYVESVERLEFKNSHDCARIADRGIAMGVFPKEVRRTTYPTFEEHYHWQKYGGHSDWIANTYMQLSGQS